MIEATSMQNGPKQRVNKADPDPTPTVVRAPQRKGPRQTATAEEPGTANLEALQRMADQSPQVARLAEFQQMADASPQVAGLNEFQRMADESPQVAELATLQRMADESPQVAELAALQRMADASPQVAELAALQSMADDWAAPVQRADLEDDELQMVQRQALDEEPLQGMALQREEGPGADRSDGLPRDLRAGMEQLSGMSLADVNVHRNSDAPAQVGAHAYAQGRDIHLAPGQEKYLPHEAWHVVQQAQGRVRPTLQARGVAINDDPGLEAEADRMGAAARSTGHTRASTDSPTLLKRNLLGSTMLSSAPLQAMGNEKNDAKELSWPEWFWKHKWKLLIAGVVTAVAAYALYRKYGGEDTSNAGTDGTQQSGGTEGPGSAVDGEGFHTEGSGSAVDGEGFHAWRPGTPYTVADKVEGLAGLVPGGGLIWEGLRQVKSGEMDVSKLLAELIKVHPAAAVPRFYDAISIALSYYSNGTVEIGTMANTISKIIAAAEKASG